MARSICFRWREFDERIANVRREKESAIDAQDFEKAASLRDREKTLQLEKAQREKEWKAGDMDVVAEVDDEQIADEAIEQMKKTFYEKIFIQKTDKILQ
mgnify:CR=1 FL=1